ncbi:hypothetical protein QYF68_04985 [Mycolicibacterium austroafricanum]|uniref:HNH endonuclease n=1 Tax=Mycolicibacterium austroafricanum TaxID=39687 RepID=A0ABT8H8U6_MYCAO|nr:hypothetical protein [Mycolicibacterium austroafricanum]MDN4517179.1 hypothetical protein [Mycolicibacterium austroafricanum]
MSDDPAGSTPADFAALADAIHAANERLVDELAAADADYAAGNTISGEELRRRYGLS